MPKSISTVSIDLTRDEVGRVISLTSTAKRTIPDLTAREKRIIDSITRKMLEAEHTFFKKERGLL